MGTVLIVGATSDVAKAVTTVYAAQGWSIVLVGRDDGLLKKIATDFHIRFQVKVHTLAFDILDFESHQIKLEGLAEIPNITIVFTGYLGNQLEGQNNWTESKKIIDVNYTGIVSLCNVIANKYEKRGSGTLAVLSSVAGERGRQSNYLYGSAKAGLTSYLSGLRNRLQFSGVHVMTVKPGFLQTKMTEDLDLPRLLILSPEGAARRIIKGIEMKKNVIYIKPIWRVIMILIRSVPETIFKRMKL